MPDSSPQFHPGLKFIPPKFNPLVLSACQLILPTYIKWQTNLDEIEAKNVETLLNLYQQFSEKKVRFLIAFRHPQTEDPFCLTYLLWTLLPKVAHAQGVQLKTPFHSHFIYDRGIPLWAGDHIGWIYSQLGGTPIIRGKIDREGLRSARDLFANSFLPMAAAPEGAVNGHNELVSPLEPGISQLSFWCVEDIYKAGRTEEVLILPLGIQYYYISEPWSEISQLLNHLETQTGLPIYPDKSRDYFYSRLLRLGFKLLEVMEDFYRRFYHQEIEQYSPLNYTDLFNINSLSEEWNTHLSYRLKILLDTALKVAEQFFNLKPKGNLIDRCRRLEQSGWDYIYREDIEEIDQLSLLEKGLANRVAEEANFRIWHMRIVETFVAVTGQYVREKMTAERFAETTLLLWDVMTRIQGGNPWERPKLGRQRVQMTIGEPISVSQRWDKYQKSRKNAATELTQDLQTALEGLIC